jgi:hypothetical protein
MFADLHKNSLLSPDISGRTQSDVKLQNHKAASNRFLR